ncbi:hypothetical protein [Marinobacterium sedimentorum]|uniref:hypothetical protein n=1 Tax=Marinobacterium sedimentorum TaxID=2927804 RepID=UPI0020C601FD|nr:hypothetical protein [Marinobacterium sedimentorum]MCP8689914.1 hypothetical protein [Marinobacterium sedimentorum]
MLVSLLLGGCLANGPVPAEPDVQVAGADSSVPKAAPGQDAASTGDSNAPTQAPGQALKSGDRPVTTAATDEALQRNLETLANRLTLMQEQLIQIKAQGAELSQQSGTALARLQMLTGSAAVGGAEDAGDNSAPAAVSGAAPEQLAGLIDQLSQIANELSLSGVGDSYRIAADYTGAGQWVLIRYDRFSGESWLADQGAWQPLQDKASLERSDYEVQLTRADNDIKGYVAARLDRRNGDTWWLKQDAWQKFE